MSVQQRVEETAVGRAVLGGVIAFVLLTLLASNLSESELRRQLTRLVAPVRDGLGLDQAWGVFAPNPRRETWDVRAELEYADGAVGHWHPGDADAVISGYRNYRWRKWAEFTHNDSEKELWLPAARWLARTYTRDGQHPVRVTLVRYWRALPPPGEKPGPENRQRSYPFFTLEVNERVLDGPP